MLLLVLVLPSSRVTKIVSHNSKYCETNWDEISEKKTTEFWFLKLMLKIP